MMMVTLPPRRCVFVLFCLARVLFLSSAFAEFEEEEDSFLRSSGGFNDDDDDDDDDAKGRRQSLGSSSSSSSSSNGADVGNRARWLFERSGSVRWSLKNEDDDEETTKSFSLKDVVGARYSDDRRGPAMEVYESTGEFVTMELAFSRTSNKNRATRRSLVNAGGKGAEVGRYFSGDGRIRAMTTTSVSSSVFALREDGEVLGYDEEKPGNIKNITKPFQEGASAHCTKSKEVFTLFRVNRESSEHQKEKLCAMCLETRRAGGRVIYNGFCAELNVDDGIPVDGDISSFSYIVSREYEPVAFQAVDDYVVALERQKKNDGMFRLQMFSSKAILVSSKLKSPIEPILAYSSNTNKGVDDDQIKVLSLTYSKFNDDDDIAPNAVPNTLGIFTLGVPIGTTTNQSDAIVLRMFNARTEDISATLASAHVTIKWTRILFVVLITIIGCSAMLLCAASAFVGAPKPFLEEDAEAAVVVGGGDVEEQLLDSILEEDTEEETEEEEEEDDEEEKQDKIVDDSKILRSSDAQTLSHENEEEKQEEKQEEEEEDDTDRRLAGGVQAFFESFLFTSSKS